MASSFPGSADTIANNVANTTPQVDQHPSLHNQLADAVVAIETALLPGGSMNLAAHVAAADPHSIYLTQTEGDARYQQPSASAALYLPLAGGTLTGNLLFSTDNTRDIGASGANRPRTIYAGTSVVTPLVTTPNVVSVGSLTLEAGSGQTLLLRANSTDRWAINGGNGSFYATTDNTVDIGYGAGTLRPRTIYAGTSVVTPLLDTPLLAPAGNVVEQRGGTNAQTMRIYTSYTDTSNYGRWAIYGALFAKLVWERAGSVGAGPVSFGNASDHVLNFVQNNVTRWTIGQNSELTPAADGASDFGSTTARVRSLYANAVGTGVKAGIAVDGDVTNPVDGMLRVDTTNHRLYVRDGATWRYAALT